MRQWKLFGAFLFTFAISSVSCWAQTATLVCNNWVFSSAKLTNRAEYVAYTQELLVIEAKKQGIPKAQIDMILQQVDAQITEANIAKGLEESRMNFKDDQSVSVSVRNPQNGQTIRAAATWALSGKRLTITTKAMTPGASDSIQEFEVASVSKSQLVLTGHGLTQIYVGAD